MAKLLGWEIKLVFRYHYLLIWSIKHQLSHDYHSQRPVKVQYQITQKSNWVTFSCIK